MAVLALPGTTGALAQINSEKKATSPIELKQDVRRPASLKDMLANLEFVISRQYLLRQSFYTAPNVMLVFGGSRVIRHDYGAELRGEVVGFDRWVVPPNLGGPVIDGIGLDFSWQATAGGVESRLRVNISGDTDLGFEDIERIFGRDWQQSNPPRSIHETLRDPTHPHGNETIEYVRRTGRIVQTLFVTFRFDGSFTRILLLGEETN